MYADYFDAGTPASSTVDLNSRFSRFQFSAFWSNGLASSVSKDGGIIIVELDVFRRTMNLFLLASSIIVNVVSAKRSPPE